MSGIVLFDSIDISQIPAGPAAVAGYVDGRWPTAQALAARFPHAHLLTIAVDPAHDADCLDIEQFDATPASAAAWWERQKARGVHRPCLYASVSTMQAAVFPALSAAGISRSAVRLWTAHYAGLHVCAHDTCGELAFPADGTQWTDHAYGRDLDQSLLAADFFTVPAPQPVPVPAPTQPALPSVPAWQEALMNKLPVLTEGAADEAGHVFWVHRMTALVKAYGEITGMADVAAQPISGTFDAAAAVNVRAVQAHAGIAADSVVGPHTWGVLVAGSAS